MGLYSKS